LAESVANQSIIDWPSTLKDVEDRLAPQLKLDAWERVVYYHLLRHTRLEGVVTKLFAIGPLSKILPLSDFKVRDVLRSLDAKGCTKNEVTRLGYKITVYIPSELNFLKPVAEHEVVSIDIETIDFFKERKYVKALLERENCRCFYCLTKLSEETCELDHVVPEAKGRNNSYRNIVSACHSCNRKKSHQDAADFIRMLLREGLLNEKELGERIRAVEELALGILKPTI
jgi:hypothetical protein